MGPTDAAFTQGIKERELTTYNEHGLRFERRFSVEGKNPYDLVEYERRSSVIREPDGTVVFEMNDLEIPKSWSQVATDIVAQKYFRKTGVPQYHADGAPKLQPDGSPVLGSETSVKQTVHRLAGTWRWWGEAYGYFASSKDAQIFYDEIVLMLLKQMAAPNSPQWFNTGLHFAYSISGVAQGHYYVDPDTGAMTRAADAYTHPQPHACGRYNTKVLTDEGLLDLGAIVDEAKVGLRVFDGERMVRVLAVKNNGVRKLYRATLRNGNYIEFTDDHRIWSAEKRMADGGVYAWRELGELLGQRVQQVASASAEAVQYAFASAVAVGAGGLSAERDTHEWRLFPFGAAGAGAGAASPEACMKAALAGFVLGDGYYGKYNKNKKTTLFGVITINEDEFAVVTDWFTKLFGSYTVAVRRNVPDLYRIVMCNSKIVDAFVEEYELAKSAYTAAVSEKIFCGSAAEKCAFLRSLFQADGCVRVRQEDGRNSGDIVLTSISEELIHGVQLLLLSLGIYSNVSPCRDRREDRHTSFQLTIAYHSERRKFAEQIGFLSEEKRGKLETLNREILGKDKRNVSEETVMAIDYVGEEEVYDIQTESGKFCANGVVVHNCFIQSVKDDLVNEGGIMDLWVREARLFKYGSGTGTNFSALRGSGEPLSGGGTSSGLMSWLKIGDRAAGAIKSGGTTRRAAKMVILDLDHPDIEMFINWKAQEEKKVAALIAVGYPSDYEGEAYQTVSGQNSNNSVRVPHKFMEALQRDGSWNMTWRTDGTVCKTLKARDLWNQIAYAAWRCADPGVQYDGTINEWHTCPQSGRIYASNPCSEYMFLDNTACNLASLNLAHFFDVESHAFLIEDFRHAVRLWTVALEISVLMAQFPSKEIAQMSYEFRTLGLGYANIGSVLMTAGIPYESEEAYAFTGAVTALLTAESYKASAEMARFLGTFPKYELNKKDMLRVMRNHRRAVFNAPKEEYEKLAVVPVGISPRFAPAYLLAAARESWNDAVAMGERHGYRNAQTTLLAPTGTIGLLMDCATTGVEPDFALVKFKKLSGGGYFKIANEAVPVALKNLGYAESDIEDIVTYMRGSADITHAPQINAETLAKKGFTLDDVRRVNDALKSAFEIQFAFNVWTLGEECMKRAGFDPSEYNDPNFRMLRAMGFSEAIIGAANEFVCGTMTIEGAPHLKTEHYQIFDCANKCGKRGERFIHYMGHVRMMAAAQPFLSGAISKTINMPNEVTLEEVKHAYEESWRLGLKAVALYRDGCKLSQPLSTSAKKQEKKDEHVLDSHAFDSYSKDGTVTEHRVYMHGEKRRLPAKRSGITIAAHIGNQQIWLRTGEYPDGKLAEIFVDMYKEGAAFRSILNMFAISVSMGLQYGVPLEKYVENFTFTRFDPAGMTDHPNVKICTSIADFIFRVLGMEYLGRTDFVQVKPIGIQKNRFQNIARLAETATVQKPLALAPPQIAVAREAQEMLPLEGAESGDPMDTALHSMDGDAPACPTCGHITVRNGACYKCLNCGDSLGCS